jgi:N-acetylglucosaminyldiphosphoundecaprenol N-acetyl-beta-D-mannosaminyltransferase
LKLSRDYQNVKFGGSYSPPFKSDLEPDDVTKIINVVNQSKCNVLFIGLTAPKQEKLMKVISERVNVNFIACIGAEFDYFGETIKRPPQFISNIGLQWVQRLISQPRKIWRRVFISGAIFIKDVIREAIS